MRVLIVDDEHLARAVLREHLLQHPDVEILGESANGFEAVKAIAELQPDLVFLDIQMPKLDGFEVAELAGARTHYLFVTAFDAFALRAFEVHALDYLLKPFSDARAWPRLRPRTPRPIACRTPRSTPW
jgi:two-component system LytT family response regulator